VAIPKHVAIIMDGNGRWAQKRNLPRIAGHEAGLTVVKDVVRQAGESGVEILSLFAFSCENWGRPKSEVEFLMRLFLQALDQDTANLHENNVKLKVIGDLQPLSPALQEGIKTAQSITANNNGLTLVVAINYSGQWDMAQAARKLAEKVQHGELNPSDITPETFKATLSLADLPDPDLFIRTSGERRLSNYYLAQLAYTELYFADALWPDFTQTDFSKALDVYAQRERRFGLVEEGVTC